MTSSLTYLFTDLEGSTRLWERHPQAMQGALARHDAILRDAVEGAGGTVVKTTGDGIMAVFDAARDAVAASVRAQRNLNDEAWGETGPLRVRMGMHVGEAQARAEDYYGVAVNRAARVMSVAHGGQILLSESTADRVSAALPAGISLRDLGCHRLKDLGAPERLFQLVAPGLSQTFPALATLDVRPNNLPTQTSAFLGRETELNHLRALLDADDVRLVTLTGPGGTGKTRLALQAAADQVDRFDDGVFFLDLSSEREPDDVYAAILRTLAIGATGEDRPLAALKRALRERRMLLLLDNFEQVTSAATGVIDVLQHCPRLEAMVTSREALRVRGEHLFPVPPLSLPRNGNGSLSLGDALGSEAVRLFGDRAAAIRPGFAIHAGNVADIVAICRRLDGLPLAIELAAARVNLFAVEELRARLDSHLDVLKAGPRDLPARQQTLRSAIEWSFDLLSEPERSVLSLFSVFVGARLADVEGVARQLADLRRIDVVEVLGSLVDKSLVRSVPEPDGRPRFTLLQTIRAYAREQLETRPSAAAAARRAHAEHYTALAIRLRRELAHAAREQVLSTLSEELGNLRSAWAFWVQEGDIVRLDDLLEPLWGYFDARGDYAAAMELGNDLLGVLSIQPQTPQRVRDEIALEMSLARSMIAVRGYTAEVERSIRVAVERSKNADDAPHEFSVLRSLATLHMMCFDFRGGLELGRQLLAIAERQADPMLLSDAHLVVGANTAFIEDMQEGLRHLDISIAHFDAEHAGLVQFRVGPSPGVVATVVSGLLLWMAGFPDRAVARVGRALDLAVRLGHPYSLAYAMFHGALLHVWRQELGLVAEQAEELLRVADEHGYPIWRALALVLRGTAWVGTGRPEDGIAEMDRGFALYAGMTTPPVFWPDLLQLRAAAYVKVGRLADAIAMIDEAESVIQHGDPKRPDLQLLRGDILLRQPAPDPAAAQRHYERAIELARDAGVRMPQLEALTRLVTLRRGTPHEAGARDALRAVVASFTEGATTRQLLAARAALDGE